METIQTEPIKTDSNGLYTPLEFKTQDMYVAYQLLLSESKVELTEQLQNYITGLWF